MARALVVDDEDALVEMIALLLEDLGHHALTAPNGREALALLADEPTLPDLIISDVMMPRMGGIEFTHAVRGDARCRAIPIILMSAGGRPRDDHQANYFLHKPFDLDGLTLLIERYIDGASGSQP